jgi:signal transduction histidine kinase
MTRSANGMPTGSGPAAPDDVAAFRAIAELAGDAAFIVDCASHTLRYLSPRAAQLLGYTPADFSAQLAAPDQPGPLAPLCAGLDNRLRRFADGDASRQQVVREFELARPGGRTVPVRVISTLLLDAAGKPATLAGMIRDQSGQRALASEQKRFASMLNHEFRTPLSTIDGAIQRLEATSRNADEASRQRYRKIGAAVDRLIAMLDEYLSPERMAELGGARAPSGIKPRQLLDEAASQARAAGRPAEVQAGELPASLRGDPAGLRLALKVLVDNALAFSSAGSPVELSASTVESGIEITVRDHGAGVPEGDAARIFDRSYRGSNAAGMPGSGLGLYMARSVLEVQGGTLELVLPCQQGAIFKIWLPNNVNRGKVVA